MPGQGNRALKATEKQKLPRAEQIYEYLLLLSAVKGNMLIKHT
jgi:hypothetical protein